MLVFTNRLLDSNARDERVLTRKYTPFAPTLNVVEAKPVSAANQKWKVGVVADDTNDAAALTELTNCFSGNKPVLVYIHGNNCAPVTCIARSQQLEDQFGVSVIAYSWTSEGYQPDGSDLADIDANEKLETDADEDSLADVKKDKLQEGWIKRKARRYAQAKTNAQHSAQSLARFLRLVAAARLSTMSQPFSVLIHSLGCHFFHYVVEHEGAAESLGVAHNVALVAGCTGSAKHAAWVGRINPVRRVYITYTKADSVLAAATIVDGDTKLGTDPGTELLIGAKYRYIDFENARKMKFGAHRYFVADPNKKDPTKKTSLPKPANVLFKRICSSQLDFAPDESQTVVYPVRCNGNGSVCYMGGNSGGNP